MVKTCSKCKKPAVTFIRYNGTHLCKDHFIFYFEKRVKKEIKKQGKTKGPCVIAVAVSGGKDSLVALNMIYKIFSRRKNVKIIAITVDEGIKNYRDESIKYAKKYCDKINVEHFTVTFKQVIGKTMDEISKIKKELGECSYCGVFRRLCLNNAAKQINADKLVTGHNLDDMVQSILMNFTNGDMKKLARLGPHKKVQPGLIPRMMPLRTIPEKENALYAILQNIDFFDSNCPYSVGAYRKKYQQIINNLEDDHPGTRHSILNSYDAIKEELIGKYPPADLNKCRKCGAPTSKDLCKSCILKKELNLS